MKKKKQDGTEQATPLRLCERLVAHVGLSAAVARGLAAEEHAELVELCYDAKGQLVADYAERYRGWWRTRHESSVRTATRAVAKQSMRRIDAAKARNLTAKTDTDNPLFSGRKARAAAGGDDARTSVRSEDTSVRSADASDPTP